MPACPGNSLVGLLLANQAQLEAGDLEFLANVLAVLSQVVRSASFAGPHLLWEALVANVMPDDLWRWGWWSHWWFHWRLWNRRWLWRLWLSLWSGSVSGEVLVNIWMTPMIAKITSWSTSGNEGLKSMANRSWSIGEPGCVLGVGCWPNCLERIQLQNYNEHHHLRHLYNKSY